MKSKILLVAPLLTILGLGSARNAAAQSAPPSSQTADQKFAAGLDHLEHGDDAAALAAFLSIPSHERTSAVHCNIGLTQSRLGRPAESIEAIEQCFESSTFVSSRPEQEQLRWRGLLVRQQKLVGRFSAVANVDGATVEVDGQPRARTPFKRALPIVAGDHEIRVTAPGHVPIVTKVTMKALDTQTVTFELVRMAELSISTKVPRAEVVVDGAVVGTTPLSTPLKLAPGDHDIEVRREGYVSFRAKKKLVAGAEQSLVADVAEDTAWIEAHGGSLTISLASEAPRIWVDGEARRLDKPSLRLAPGVHHVVVVKDGFERIEREVEIERGATIALRLVPTQAAFDASVARFERQRRWGIGLLAGGAVLAGGGAGVLGYFTQQAGSRDYVSEEVEQNGMPKGEVLALCDPENHDGNDTGCAGYRVGQVLGGVGLGLGVAMLVAGAWLTVGNDQSPPYHAARERRFAGLPIVPILGVTPGRPEASLGLLGSF